MQKKIALPGDLFLFGCLQKKTQQCLSLCCIERGKHSRKHFLCRPESGILLLFFLSFHFPVSFTVLSKRINPKKPLFR